MEELSHQRKMMFSLAETGMRYQRRLKLVCWRAWATGIQVSICVCCSGRKEMRSRSSRAAKSAGRLSFALSRLQVVMLGKTAGAGGGLGWGEAGGGRAAREGHGARQGH